MTHENHGARPRLISWSIAGVTLLILAASALLPRFAGATRHVAQPAFDSAQPAPQAELDVTSVPQTLPIAGRVVDRKGQPVAGAKVYLYVDPDEPLTHTPISPPVRATSGADGRFRFTVDRIELASGLVRNGYPSVFLAAFAEGYGPAWTKELTIDDPDGNRLELVADDAPITGRLIDLEGRPLPDVTVRVVQVDATPTEDLSPWLSATQSNPNTAYQSFYDVHEVAAGQPLDVDSTGRDRLRRTIPAPRCGPRADCLDPDPRRQDPDAGRAGDDARRAVELDPVPASPTGADGTEHRYFDLRDRVRARCRPRAECRGRRRRCCHGPAGSGSGHPPQNDLPPGIRELLSAPPMAVGHVDTSHDGRARALPSGRPARGPSGRAGYEAQRRNDLSTHVPGTIRRTGRRAHQARLQTRARNSGAGKGHEPNDRQARRGLRRIPSHARESELEFRPTTSAFSSRSRRDPMAASRSPHCPARAWWLRP